MIEIITAVLGIALTLVAWIYNPKRRIQAELDSIYKSLEVLYVKRDTALANNDADVLSVVTIDITKLLARKADLLKRLG